MSQTQRTQRGQRDPNYQRYAGVSIERLQAVANVLKLRINEVVTVEKE
jgi:hypothetical protein